MRSTLVGLLCVLGICLPPAAHAQGADLYRGTVVNSAFPDRPATLELSIFSRTDTSTTAWLGVGAPLGGSGFASIVPRGLDSLYLVSVSSTQDTIIWASATRTGTIGGEYWISGGPSDGQSGTWRLEPQPHLSVATLTMIALFIAIGGTLLVYVGSTFVVDAWWRRRDPASLALPEEQRRKLDSIGGWLALFVVANAAVALYLLVTVGEVTETLGTTWMLSSAVPGMRVTLMIEAATHLFQVLGLIVGLVLIFRKSPLAPPFWTGFLVLLAVAAGRDIIAGDEAMRSMNAIFGPGLAESAIAEMRRANDLNMKVVLRTVIWGLYFLRSKRVRVVFSPNRTSPAPAPEVVPPAAYANEPAI